MLSRWKMFNRILFVGTTQKVDPEKLREVELRWPHFTDATKDATISGIREKRIAKRASMGETAARANYKYTGMAFILAGIIAVMLAPSTGKAAHIVLQTSASILLGAGGLILIIISAKGKVMRRKLDYVPKGIDMALEEYAAQLYYAACPSMSRWHEYVSETIMLHKCEMILLTERRGAWVGSMFAVAAVLLAIVGINL